MPPDDDRTLKKLDETNALIGELAITLARQDERLKDLQEKVQVIPKMQEAIASNTLRFDIHVDDYDTQITAAQKVAILAHIADEQIHLTPAEDAELRKQEKLTRKRQEYWSTNLIAVMFGAAGTLAGIIAVLHDLGLL